MCRCIVPLLSLLLAALSPAAGGPARDFRFTRDSLGKLPAGWKAERTGKGKGSVWKVVADATAPGKTGHALAQTAAGPSSLFNLCIAEGTRFQNGEVSVAFKAVAGKLDQGGGIVWRLQDANNYYVARMNPLEDNLRFYKVVAGKRTQLATKEGLKVPTGEWHTLKIRQMGDRIACYLDGKKQLEATDRTFLNAGRVGLWTKADAQTNFDNLAVIQARD